MIETEANNVNNNSICITNNLENDIDYLLSNGPVRGLIQVKSETPMILQKYGVENLPIAMQSTHILENVLNVAEAYKKGFKVTSSTHYHGIGKEQFIKSIKALDNPIQIYKWKKNKYNNYTSDDYVILTNILTENNERIIIPMVLKKNNIKNIYEITTGKLIKTSINEIKTIYGKKQVYYYLNRYLKDGSLVSLNLNKNRDGGGIQSSTDNSANK